jgi:Protein of unknown function (DUF3618)
VNEQDSAALRAEIAQTRTELGHTIQELAERVDVKSRVQHSMGRSVRRAQRSPVPWFVLAASASAALVLMILAGRGRR